MISLFLSTFSSFLHIALLKDNLIIKEKYIKLDKELSKMALVNVKELFDETKINPKDTKEIICVEGPGSFTGLRVGVTIAKSFAYSLDLDIIPISSLFLMATSIKNSNYIIPYIDARRGYVYASIYDKNYNKILKDSYTSFEELSNKAKELGDVTFVSYDKLNDETKEYLPDLENTLKYINKKPVKAMTFIPNYLKKTEAEENLS